MTLAEKRRSERTDLRHGTPGIKWKIYPNCEHPSTQRTVILNSETTTKYLTDSLFADDTTILADAGGIDNAVASVKCVIKEFEEHNDDKEEILRFGKSGVMKSGC